MRMTKTPSCTACVQRIASFSKSCLLINGLISFDLQGIQGAQGRRCSNSTWPTSSSRFSGAVELFGIAESWNFNVYTIGSTRFPVWTREDFQFSRQGVSTTPLARMHC